MAPKIKVHGVPVRPFGGKPDAAAGKKKRKTACRAQPWPHKPAGSKIFEGDIGVVAF